MHIPRVILSLLLDGGRNVCASTFWCSGRPLSAPFPFFFAFHARKVAARIFLFLALLSSLPIYSWNHVWFPDETFLKARIANENRFTAIIHYCLHWLNIRSKNKIVPSIDTSWKIVFSNFNEIDSFRVFQLDST